MRKTGERDMKNGVKKEGEHLRRGGLKAVRLRRERNRERS